MKYVLYVGDFSPDFSTENYVTYGLQALGYTVLKVQEKDVPNARSLLGVALNHKVEFVLFSKGKFSAAKEAISLMRAQNIITVTWIFDLFFDCPGRQKLTSPTFHTDLVCLTDGGHLDKWQENHVNHRLLRQGIHWPEAYLGTKRVHPEIVFIGTYNYKERIEMIEFLKLTYKKNFRHYGRGSAYEEIRGRELNNVLASAKIVVGDSMPSENYWSNRIYEITGRGGFLLHPRISGLETEFIDGVHYVVYTRNDFQGLKKLIDHYLLADKERETIRIAGHQHTKKNYTYTERCKKMIEYIDAEKIQRRSRICH